MVYVLCRIVDDPRPPMLLNLESSDAAGRHALVQQALAAFNQGTQDDASVNIFLQDGSLADLSTVGEGSALYFDFGHELPRPPAAPPPAINNPPPLPPANNDPLPSSPPRLEQSILNAPATLERASTPVAAPPLPRASVPNQLQVPAANVQREALPIFIQHLRALPTPKSNTISFEIAAAFEATMFREAPEPSSEALDGAFFDASAQALIGTWIFRCSRSGWKIHRLALDQSAADPLAPIVTLFELGWFRPETPHNQVRATTVHARAFVPPS